MLLLRSCKRSNATESAADAEERPVIPVRAVISLNQVRLVARDCSLRPSVRAVRAVFRCSVRSVRSVRFVNIPWLPRALSRALSPPRALLRAVPRALPPPPSPPAFPSPAPPRLPRLLALSGIASRADDRRSSPPPAARDDVWERAVERGGRVDRRAPCRFERWYQGGRGGGGRGGARGCKVCVWRGRGDGDGECEEKVVDFGEGRGGVCVKHDVVRGAVPVRHGMPCPYGRAPNYPSSQPFPQTLPRTDPPCGPLCCSSTHSCAQRLLRAVRLLPENRIAHFLGLEVRVVPASWGEGRRVRQGFARGR